MGDLDNVGRRAGLPSLSFPAAAPPAALPDGRRGMAALRLTPLASVDGRRVPLLSSRSGISPPAASISRSPPPPLRFASRIRRRRSWRGPAAVGKEETVEVQASEGEGEEGVQQQQDASPEDLEYVAQIKNASTTRSSHSLTLDQLDLSRHVLAFETVAYLLLDVVGFLCDHPVGIRWRVPDFRSPNLSVKWLISGPGASQEEQGHALRRGEPSLSALMALPFVHSCSTHELPGLLPCAGRGAII